MVVDNCEYACVPSATRVNDAAGKQVDRKQWYKDNGGLPKRVDMKKDMAAAASEFPTFDLEQ